MSWLICWGLIASFVVVLKRITIYGPRREKTLPQGYAIGKNSLKSAQLQRVASCFEVLHVASFTEHFQNGDIQKR